MPRVLNKYLDNVTGAVCIMRGTPWGNPYVIGKDGTREEVILKYRQYLDRHPYLLEAARQELRGRDLYCCCKPKACHGDILIQVANE